MGAASFISVDPGTHRTGVVLWIGETPIKTWLLNTSARAPTHERLKLIMDGLEVIHRNYARNISLVVCEKAPSMTGQRPAPELQTLVREIGHWAKEKKLNFIMVHPSSVVAYIRPRGTKGMDNKEIIELGVRALYGDLVSQVTTQDILDAVAVGHVYVSHQRENALRLI